MFLDCTIAFDRVSHDTLFNVQEEFNINSNGVCSGRADVVVR